MSSDLTDANARFLLGEAVRLLTQSGVTGVALAEFVLGFTPIVNQRLAAIASSTSTAGMADRVTRADVKDAVKEALQEVVSATGESQEGRGKNDNDASLFQFDSLMASEPPCGWIPTSSSDSSKRPTRRPRHAKCWANWLVPYRLPQKASHHGSRNN